MAEKKTPKKKPAKKQPAKKAPAKKQAVKKTAKKAAAPKKKASSSETSTAKKSSVTVGTSTTTGTPNVQVTMTVPKEVASAITSVTNTVVRANDVVSPTLRKRMLRWFRRGK